MRNVSECLDRKKSTCQHSLHVDPPLVAINVAPKGHSHTLIEESKEFVVNIPTLDIVKETPWCGRISGRDQDKFRETSLTPMAAEKVKPPIIEECVSHLGCRLQGQLETGDHNIFVGKVTLAYTNKNVYGEKMFFIWAETDFPLWP
jgi:flavin reductase (DIM6/NTAB) family NADH-FMN oxidoreductase RutF